MWLGWIVLIILAVPNVVAAQTTGINPIPLIVQDESSGNPTAQNPTSTASGLFGDLNSTWAAALAACNCGTTAQYPTAASAPANIQYAANAALINTQGLQPWLCAGCDPQFAAQVAAAGGPGAFQTSGLDTNPADYANGVPSATTTTTTPTTAAGTTTNTAAAGGGNVNEGYLDQITLAFQNATAGWQAALFTVASDLFWLLAGIELAAMLIILIISGGRPDWSDVVFTVIRWMFAVLPFYWLMQHGTEFAGDIIRSLRLAATDAGGIAITPSSIIASGINVAGVTWEQFHLSWNPATLVGLMIAALVIIVCFTLTAVWMAMALIEGYFVVGAAALFLAFGGMRWSRQIAVSLLMFCLGIGMKLFTMSMIVGIGSQFITQWTTSIPYGNAGGYTIRTMMTVIGISVFLAALAKFVPDTMQRVILAAPVSLAHYSQPIGEGRAVAAATVGTAAAAVGAPAIAFQAFMHAAEQAAAKDHANQGGVASSLQFAGNATGAVARAAGAEIGARLGGFARGGAGASAVRMAQNVGQQRRVFNAQQSRPQPPSGS